MTLIKLNNMEWITKLANMEWLFNIVRAAAILIIGLLMASFLSRATARLLREYLSAQSIMIIRKSMFYLLVVITLVSALSQLGFDIKVLLGAAGILTVAIGFASQTSASNLISGLFLVIEQPFVVGDAIKVGETTGIVLSVDLLSTRIRTYDNIMVRIPNESLMKSQIANFTHFPIRRIDLSVGVAYKEDLRKVREVLLEVARQNNLCLDEPHPVFIVSGFGDSSVNITFCVWLKRQNFLAVKNGIQEEIKKAFDENDIEIPFPHRSMYTGSVTQPFPIKIVNQSLLRGKP